MRSIHSPPSVIMWIFTREPCGMAGEPSACMPNSSRPYPALPRGQPSHSSVDVAGVERLPYHEE